MQKNPGVSRLIFLFIFLAFVVIPGRQVIAQTAAPVDKQSGVPDAVWLYDNWKVEVSPTRGIILDIERRARVNSPAGRTVGRLKIWETFYQSLKKFQGAVTDTAGGILYDMDKDELETGFPFSDYRLYSEDRLYEVELTAPSFPYHVEYSYRLNIDNTFFWPDWVFTDSFLRRSVSYTVAVPHLFTYRTREVYSGLSVDSNRKLKRDVTRWTAADVVPDTLGVGAPYPVMYVAPENFVVARQRGSTESWASLGRWYGKLTGKRRKLAKNQAAEVKTWPTDPTDPRRIAAELKEIVSHDWRYVAIEVGIGGWRPHEAKSVFKSRYGDCKDLTFLWLAMLDQFAIEAYPALVRTRNRQTLAPDFPKDWFDHVIGCAIIGGDTIWADLTAPSYPAGTLPYQAEDRYALLITEDEGVLCKTPASVPGKNRLVRSLTGELDQAGDLSFSLRAHVSGHKLRLFGGGSSAGNNNRKAAEILGVLPGRLATDSMSFDPGHDGLLADVQMRGKIAEWAEFTRQRVIFPLAFAGWAAPQPMLERANGRSAVQRPYPCHEIDSLLIVLPPGYAREFVPENVQIDEGPVRFAFTARFAGDTLIYVRNFLYAARRAETLNYPGPSWRTITAIQYADAVFVRHGERDTSTSSAADSAASEFD